MQRKTDLKYTPMLFAAPAKTGSEKFLHSLANCCPPTGISQKLHERQERYAISQEVLAFRADSREPQKMFDLGFSAYAFERIFNWMFCYCCTPTINAAICVGCFPFLCLYHGVECCCCHPGQYCGNNNVIGAHNTSWSALSFSSEFSHARPASGANNHWRYIVVLQGAIDFTTFSIDYLNQNEDDCCVNSLDKPEWELLPRDLTDQTVPPEQIIAAVKIQDGVYSVLCNHRFSQWDRVANFLTSQKLSTDAKELKMKDINPLMDFLKTLPRSSSAPEILASPPEDKSAVRRQIP